jgi:hypothetical protein
VSFQFDEHVVGVGCGVASMGAHVSTEREDGATMAHGSVNDK